MSEISFLPLSAPQYVLLLFGLALIMHSKRYLYHLVFLYGFHVCFFSHELIHPAGVLKQLVMCLNISRNVSRVTILSVKENTFCNLTNRVNKYWIVFGEILLIMLAMPE